MSTLMSVFGALFLLVGIYGCTELSRILNWSTAIAFLVCAIANSCLFFSVAFMMEKQDEILRRLRGDWKYPEKAEQEPDDRAEQEK